MLSVSSSALSTSAYFPKDISPIFALIMVVISQFPSFFSFFVQEVPMIPRPHYAQPGCVYYICLLRDDLLLRQGMC